MTLIEMRRELAARLTEARTLLTAAQTENRALNGEENTRYEGMAIFQMTAVCYYLANGGLSSIENAALMGVPFPPKIKDALQMLKKKGDAEDTPDETT